MSDDIVTRARQLRAGVHRRKLLTLGDSELASNGRLGVDWIVEFDAAAPELVDGLLAEVERLREERER